MIGEREALAISSRSLDYSYLTITESTASWLKILMIGIIPIIYIGIGIVVLVRRRRAQK